MQPPFDPLPLADLLAIETLRDLEHGAPEYRPSVDLPLAGQIDADPRGGVAHPEEALAQRADRVLSAEYGLGRQRIADGLRFVRLGWVALLVVVGALATGICANRLLVRGSNEPVSIDGFAMLLGLNLLLAVPPTLLMIASLFGGRAKEKASHGGFVADLVQDVARLFLLVYWLLVAALQVVRNRWLKRLGPGADRALRPLEAVNALLRVWSGVLLRGLGLTSHLAWCVALSVVLASFLASAVFRQYDFRWQSTWLDDSSKLAALQAACAPIAGLPLVPVPDEDLVRYLDEERFPAETRATHRAASARLLFAMLLYYGLLPRCLLAAIAGVQVARSVRALRPKLGDPYFRQVLERLQLPPMGSSDDIPKGEDRAERGSAPAAASPGATQIQRPASACAAMKPAAAPASKLAVAAFEVAVPKDAWLSTFALDERDRAWVLGNAADRASRKAVVDALTAAAPEIARVLLVASLREAPDDLFLQFLAALLASLPAAAAAETVLVLTGGEALREKFGGDADRVEGRVRLWRQRAAACGVSPDRVVEFDHENATSEARRLLRARLDGLWRAGSSGGTGAAPRLHRANRFAEAARLIVQCAEQAAQTASPEEMERQTQSLHARLRELYGRETGLLTKALAKAGPDLERFGQSLADAGRQAGQHAADRLRDGLAAWTNGAARIRAYLGGLSGRWAAAGGLVAALGLTSLGLTPALVGGAVASLFGLHAPLLLAKLGWRRDPAEPGEAAAERLSLDDLVRSSVVWALVLEVQGSPEESIARALAGILADLDRPVASAGEARQLLDTVSGRLEALGAQATYA